MGSSFVRAKENNMTEDEVVKKIMLEPMPKKQFIEVQELADTAAFLMTALLIQVAILEIIDDSKEECTASTYMSLVSGFIGILSGLLIGFSKFKINRIEIKVNEVESEIKDREIRRLNFVGDLKEDTIEDLEDNVEKERSSYSQN